MVKILLFYYYIQWWDTSCLLKTYFFVFFINFSHHFCSNLDLELSYPCLADNKNLILTKNALLFTNFSISQSVAFLGFWEDFFELVDKTVELVKPDQQALTMMHTLEVEAFEDELLDDVDDELCDESLLFDPDVEILGNSVWNKKISKLFFFNLKAFKKMFISSELPMSFCKCKINEIGVCNK